MGNKTGKTEQDIDNSKLNLSKDEYELILTEFRQFKHPTIKLEQFTKLLKIVFVQCLLVRG